MKRTDRWLALLALTYVTADELSRSPTDTSEWESQFKKVLGKTTGRTITAKLVSLSANAVTNALTQAANRNLFTRQRLPGDSLFTRARPRNRSGGRLTEDGWNALGAVP
jgi:hypothetical protein